MNGSGQRQNEGGEMDIIYIAIGILCAIGAVLYFFHDQILTALLWLKYYELKLISALMPNTQFRGLENWINMTSVQRVTYGQLGLLSSEIGNVIKVPCAVISVALGVILYFLHPQRLYTDIETTKSLADKVSSIFPAIKVVEELNLVKDSVDEGHWRMAQTPIEFAKHHRLIQRDPESGELKINQLRAKMAFTAQLGGKWRGVEALKPYEKAIFAVVAAFVNYKRDDAEAVLERIAASIKKKNLLTGDHDFSSTGVLLKKYATSPSVTEITQNHAYVKTVFTEMLNQARRSGIVANSLYLWLKPLDRTLWYTLNNVGRKAVFTEAGAIHAHWLAEKQVGYAVQDAMIDKAIRGLSIALKERVVEHNEEDEQPKPTSKPRQAAAKKKASAKAAKKSRPPLSGARRRRNHEFEAAVPSQSQQLGAL